MALQAKFYNCAAAPNTLDKTYTPANASNVTINNYEPISDIAGYLYLSSGKISFNYLLLNGKYYFVGPREYMSNGMCRVRLDEDVLETFKAGIKALGVVVGRNQVYKAAEMYDEQLRTLQRTAAYCKILGSFAYDMTSKILVTVG